MKTITTLLLLTTLTAEAHVFDCRDGDVIDTLVLDDHSAKILDVTLINMMEVDYGLQYRGYSFINDPWYALTIDTEMVSGKDGYAQLRAHELQYGQTVVSKFYQCTLRQ